MLKTKYPRKIMDSTIPGLSSPASIIPFPKSNNCMDVGQHENRIIRSCQSNEATEMEMTSIVDSPQQLNVLESKSKVDRLKSVAIEPVIFLEKCAHGPSSNPPNSPIEELHALEPRISSNSKQAQVSQSNCSLGNVSESGNKVRESKPMLVIPLDNIICHMDKSEFLNYLQQKFDDFVLEFEAYAAETTSKSTTKPSKGEFVSIEHIWRGFLREKYPSSIGVAESQSSYSIVKEEISETLDNSSIDLNCNLANKLPPNDGIEVKVEDIFDAVDESHSNAVQIIDVQNHPIEILDSEDLLQNFQFNAIEENSSTRPFAISHQSSQERCSNIERASSG